MSKRKLNLYRLSLNSLCNWLSSMLHIRTIFQNSNQFVQLYNYLDYLPYKIRDEIMDKLVNGLYFDRMVRIRALRLLLNKQCHNLILWTPCESNLSIHFLKVIRQQGKNLRHLDLQAIFLMPKDSKEFEKILKTFHRLEKFHVNLRYNCGVYHTFLKGITRLQIKINDCILNSDLDSTVMPLQREWISQLTELRVCDWFPVSTLAKIILCLPSLTSLGEYPMSGLVLCLLKPLNIILKLEQFYDEETSPETLSNILDICPKIRNMNLCMPILDGFEILSQFQNLVRLRLEDMSIFKYVPMTHLQILELLHIHTVVDLISLLTFCPNLDKFVGVNLEMSEHFPNVSQFDHSLTSLYLENIRCTNMEAVKDTIYLLTKLETLFLKNIYILNYNELKYFIERSIWKNLDRVYICINGSVGLTRYDLDDILKKNCIWNHLTREKLGYKIFVIDLYNDNNENIHEMNE